MMYDLVLITLNWLFKNLGRHSSGDIATQDLRCLSGGVSDTGSSPTTPRRQVSRLASVHDNRQRGFDLQEAVNQFLVHGCAEPDSHGFGGQDDHHRRPPVDVPPQQSPPASTLATTPANRAPPAP